MSVFPDAAWRKSTRSGNSACVEVAFSDAAWHKSTWSGSGGCVEVATAEGAVGVRDSKDCQGPVLVFNRIEWDAFLAGVRDGEFDPPSR